MSATKQPTRESRMPFRLLAVAVLVTCGACGVDVGAQAEALEAMSARLDKLEAEHARMAKVWIPLEKELEAKVAEKAKAEAEFDATMKDVLTRFDKLEAEQARIERERTSLEIEIEAAKGDGAKREELEAKLKAIDEQMAAYEGKADGPPAVPKHRTGASKKSALDDDPLGAI